MNPEKKKPYHPELEDLLADLEVLTKFERRLKKHPDLMAKIDEVVRTEDLEATIKAVAAIVRKHLGQ